MVCTLYKLGSQHSNDFNDDILLVLLALPAGALLSDAVVKCQSRSNVAFVIDASDSMVDVFEKEKVFIKKVAESLNIGGKESHIGIVTFSSKAKVVLKFSEKNNASVLEKSVDSLSLLGGTSRLDTALKLAFDGLFQDHGMRLDVPQVLILLTDGAQTRDISAVPPSQAIAPFHESNVKVLVVGIGEKAKKAELAGLVKSTKDLFMAKSGDDLISDKVLAGIRASSCQPGRHPKVLCLFLLPRFDLLEVNRADSTRISMKLLAQLMIACVAIHRLEKEDIFKYDRLFLEGNNA